MDNIVKLDRQTSWIKEARSVNFDLRISARVHNSWQWAWKVAQHSFLSLQIQVLLFPVSLSLFFLLAHTTEEQRCWSQSPTCSSNMQPGSQMIKAVAGGLHFETINRPVGAESNSKPSISVSPSRSVAQREGELGGREGSLHLCILSLHGSTLLRGRWGGVGESHGSLMWFQAGFVDSSVWPLLPSNDQEQLQGHYISPPHTQILGEQVYRCYYKSGINVSKLKKVGCLKLS